jgi:soluble lytic murein transglycosylase-like protein
MTTDTIITTIRIYAALFGVDPDLAVSVANVESRLNPNAVGDIGEVGLFQVRPEYAKPFTRTELFKPEVNIVMGVMKLKAAKLTCMHQSGFTWLTCYNAGNTGAKRIKQPKNFSYVRKVTAEYEKRNNSRYIASEWMRKTGRSSN